MPTKFELNTSQQSRVDAWFKHHWEVYHKDFRPREMSGAAVQYIFGPTGMGCNSKVVCIWCTKDSPCGEVDLTEDDDGEFIYEYDSDWKRLPAPWEAPKSEVKK